MLAVLKTSSWKLKKKDVFCSTQTQEIILFKPFGAGGGWGGIEHILLIFEQKIRKKHGSFYIPKKVSEEKKVSETDVVNLSRKGDKGRERRLRERGKGNNLPRK